MTTGVVTAAIAFFIPEDVLANAISIGTLTAFSLVDAAVVVVRMRTPANPHKSIVLVLAYTALAFVASVLLAYAHSWGQWALYAAAVLGVAALIVLVVLCMQPQPPSLALSKGFQTPLVPIVPCIGILINVNMMAGLDSQAWIRLAVWYFAPLFRFLFFFSLSLCLGLRLALLFISSTATITANSECPPSTPQAKRVH